MKLLCLVSDGFGGHGGISVYNQELLSALAARAQVSQVRVLPRFGAGPTAHAKLIQDAPVRHPLRYCARTLSRAVQEPFDWVFCGHLHHLPLARVAAALCGARVWLQLHGIEAWHVPGRMLHVAARHCDLVTVVSRYTRERFLSWCDIDPQRVKVLSNTWAPHFTPGESDQRWRARFAPHGEAVILTVSRLQRSERYKGHQWVMRALCEPTLVGEPAPVYVIAGQGDDVQWLREQARALGLESRVFFIGVVDAQTLCSLYRSADVFVMPSTGEGFGIVFLEALACGLPVVAGDSDGARDALRDGLLGELVNARDAGAIAQAIARAISAGVAADDAAAREPTPGSIPAANLGTSLDCGGTPIADAALAEGPQRRTARTRSGGDGVEVFSRANFAAQLDDVLHAVALS